MSYHLGPGQRAAPQQYPLYPLAQVPPAALMDERTKRALIIIGLLLLAAIVVSMMMKKKAPVTRNAAARKLTTPELAKSLYSRLEKKSGTNPAVLRSLSSYASKR